MQRSYRDCVRVALFGGVTVDVGDHTVELPAAKERAILGLLALKAGSSVRVDTIIDTLWPEDPPPSARKAVQTYVARLRKRLPDGVVASTADGYCLVRDCDVDVYLAAGLAERGRAHIAAAEFRAARAVLQEALGLCRGELLPELLDAPGLAGERTRVAELRLVAEEDLLDVDLALGEHMTAVGTAESAVAAEPLRERRWAQLMLALYRSGRQADALRAFQRCRDTLVGELGVEPGPDLRGLEQSILSQDPILLYPTDQSIAGDEPFRIPSGVPPVLEEATRRPLVGRVATLEELERIWAAVCEGGRGTVLLSGEPGVGKSRVVAELAERVAASGGAVLCGRCLPDLELPFQPFAEGFAPWLADADQSSGDDALVRAVTSVGTSEHDDDEPRPWSDAAVDQYRVYEAAAALLARAARLSPVLLVLEDLHWATPPTVRMLRYLATSPDLSRVLLVGTRRDTGGVDLSDFGELSTVSQIVLGPLSVEEVTALVALRTHSDAELARELHRLAGGNPFLVEQLLLDREADATVLTDSTPRRASEVVKSRLARLGRSTRGILELAALVGASFDVSRVVAAHHDDQESVLDALEEAEAAGLIRPSHPLGHFEFCHDLVRAVLIDQLAASRALRLHRDLALSIERRHPSPAQLGPLARHCAAAAPLGLAPQAIVYGQQAGSHARQSYAFEEAAEFFTLALEAMALADEEDPALRCDLLTARGEALHRAGEPDYRTSLADAASLARRSGDARRLAEIAFAHYGSGGLLTDMAGSASLDAAFREALRTLGDSDPSLRARLLAAWADELGYGTDHSLRQQVGTEALELARANDDPALLAEVLAGVLASGMLWSELRQRTETAAELTALARTLDDDELRCRGASYLLLAKMEALDIDGARDARDELREAAARVRLPTIDWQVGVADAADRLLSGDLAGAEQLAAETAALGRRAGVPEINCATAHAAVVCVVRLEQGRLGELEPLASQLSDYNPGSPFRYLLPLVHLEAGNPTDALTAFEVIAKADFEDVPQRRIWAVDIANAAEAAAELDHRDGAAALFELFQPFSGRLVVTDPTRHTVVDRVLGRLCTTLGLHRDADRYLDGAAAQCQRLGAPLLLARVHLDQARLAGRQRDGQRVREAADKAITLAEPRGADGIVATAQRLIGVL